MWNCHHCPWHCVACNGPQATAKRATVGGLCADSIKSQMNRTFYIVPKKKNKDRSKTKNLSVIFVCRIRSLFSSPTTTFALLATPTCGGRLATKKGEEVEVERAKWIQWASTQRCTSFTTIFAASKYFTRASHASYTQIYAVSLPQIHL